MPFTRVHPKAGKHKELGQKIVGWSLDPTTRPALNPDGTVADLDSFKVEMADLVEFPDEITAIKFVFLETDHNGNYTYYIRVPLKQLVEKSTDELNTLQEKIDSGEVAATSASYEGLDFYSEFVGTSPSSRNYPDMLLRRIADYTFSGCK